MGGFGYVNIGEPVSYDGCVYKYFMLHLVFVHNDNTLHW